LNFLKKLKIFFNQNFFYNVSFSRKENMEKLIYKNYKSSIDAIESQNNYLLSTKQILEIK